MFWFSLNRTRKKLFLKIANNEKILIKVIIRLFRNKKILKKVDAKTKRITQCFFF